MNPSDENVYAAWRNRLGATEVLHDANGFPAERLLQAVWQHQRLRRDRLRTADGRAVRVLHPGFVSVEGGPDFRGAVIQIGDEPPRAGDVEVDLRRGGWQAHHHDRNPSFQNVILHVVWETGAPTPGPAQIKRPPALPLTESLDAPLGELSSWLEGGSAIALPENLRGKCSAPLRELDETQTASLLRQAARVRLEGKAAQFSVRARQAGWEQALWEGLFRALGYKHNTWAMQNLAESRQRWTSGIESSFEFQARLLGIAGLLPPELTRSQKSSDTYLRRVWDGWWRERDAFADCILSRRVWKFHGLRPANHPQRRLALASHWLADKRFISKIEHWCHSDLADDALLSSLAGVLQVKDDDYWSWHWTFKSARLARPHPLLGEARVTDLAVNIILPWLWARAAEGKNARVRCEVERRYFGWPVAEDNAVLKLARQRLLGNSNRRPWRTAAAQQGLMQIVGDFCAHSNAVCDNCRFPELAREFGVGRSRE
ncbi:MAG TPA: DUF2851 family protein [Verrucomicrobiae bacterium]|nr:DUF2851 family protein [Verrucomicrobiae bacterium]